MNVYLNACIQECDFPSYLDTILHLRIKSGRSSRTCSHKRKVNTGEVSINMRYKSTHVKGKKIWICMRFGLDGYRFTAGMPFLLHRITRTKWITMHRSTRLNFAWDWYRQLHTACMPFLLHRKKRTRWITMHMSTRLHFA